MGAKNDGLKYFVVLIGWILWFPLSYYSFIGINKFIYLAANIHLSILIIFLIILFFVWLLQFHKVFLSLFFISFNIRWVKIVYCLLGLFAFILYYKGYNDLHPIFKNTSNIAILQETNISTINKSFLGGIYLMLMLIFVPNYLLYPFISKYVK
jgi:hypothetical protein